MVNFSCHSTNMVQRHSQRGDKYSKRVGAYNGVLELFHLFCESMETCYT